MNKFILVVICLMLAGKVDAAILVLNPLGGLPATKLTLESARTALDVAGKTIVVTSPLTQAQSNISAAWPSDRAIKIESGGSISNSTAFTIGGAFIAGNYTVFKGSGNVVFTTGSVDRVMPEWWGTGTSDDSVPINKALQAASNIPVVLSKEYYTITNPILPPNYSTIDGPGGLYVAPGGGSYGSSDISLIEIRQKSGVRIRGVKFSGANKSYVSDNYGSNGCGVLLMNATDCTITGNDIVNVNCGVRLVRSSNNIVSNNNIHGNIAQDGVQILGFIAESTYAASVANYNTISNNLINSSTTTVMGIRVSGTASYPGRHNTVVGNTIYLPNSQVEGLLTEYAEYNTFASNTVNGPYYGGVIYTGSYNIFTGNTFLNNIKMGIGCDGGNATSRTLSYNIFSDNQVIGAGTDTGGQSVVISKGAGAGNVAIGNIVKGNVITGGNLNNIYINATNTKISGNIMSGALNNAIVLADGSHYTQISDNQITSTTTHGIYAAASNNTVVNGNTFIGNGITNMSAIFLNGGTYHSVSGNTVKNWWRGITLVSITSTLLANVYDTMGAGGSVDGGGVNIYPNSVSAGDIQTLGVGSGIVVKTPDGTKNYRISISNGGTVTVTNL